MTNSQMQLLAAEQAQTTTDDYYTPAWVFETLALEFALDVAAPPHGIPWIPARRSLTMHDDGLATPWEGRVWMNPPFSNLTPWVDRFIAHGHGICLLPFSKSRWFFRLWAEAHGIVAPERGGSWRFAGNRSISWPIFFAAFGDECTEAIGRLGILRTAAA